MLVLRLVRTGRRNQPKFRLVAAEQGKKVKGAVVEILGHYEPAAKDKPFVFDKEKVQGWIARGGMPSNTVAKLLNMNGFTLPVHQNAPAKPRKKAQAKLDEASKPKESAPVVEVTDSGEEVAPVAEEAVVNEAEPVMETPPIEESAVETETPSGDEPAAEVAATEPTNEEA